MDYTAYLQLLKELGGELEQLNRLQQEKIQAVRDHDLDGLNQCMKQEQAISLALRGLEQRRDKVVRELGLEGVPLKQVPQRCPKEQYGAVSPVVEELLKKNQQLHSAQKAARSMMERELRRIDRELEKQGVDLEVEEGYRPIPGTPPHGMRTDFRA